MTSFNNLKAGLDKNDFLKLLQNGSIFAGT